MPRLTRPRFHLTYANVMSSVAVFVALGGTSYAVAQLPKNSVGEKQLRTGAVTSDKIQDGAIARSDLAPGAVASGPRGPRGESGPAGPAGTNGAAGATGPAGASAAPEAWKPIPFTDGWKSVVELSGGELQAAQYRKDAFGRVELRGMATYWKGDPSTATQLATLPAGYRPKGIRAFIVASGGADINGPAQINIQPNGALLRMFATTNAEQDFIMLDGITFEVD